MFSLICITLCAEPPEYDKEVCKGQEDGNLIGIPGHCSYYYYCESEIGYREDCTSFGNFEFDSKIGNCNYPEEANCVELETPDFECPTDRPGKILLFESSNCAKYYICANGVRLTLKCIEGLVFNPKNKQCDHPVTNPRCLVRKYSKIKS
jgi:hypothetical protein